MKMIRKGINVLLTVLFIAFAVFQLNDPDALLWIGIYGVAAIFSLAAIFNKYELTLTKIFGIAAASGLAYLSPEAFDAYFNYDPSLAVDETVTHTTDVQTEVLKEFFGLFIVLLSFIWQYISGKQALDM